jgi:hypothetical protein
MLPDIYYNHLKTLRAKRLTESEIGHFDQGDRKLKGWQGRGAAPISLLFVERLELNRGAEPASCTAQLSPLIAKSEDLEKTLAEKSVSIYFIRVVSNRLRRLGKNMIVFY